MAVKLKESENGKWIEAHLTGKLVKKDYETFLPVLNRLIKKQGQINILVAMKDFQGWTAVALWVDLKFNAKHYNEIKRVAIVGETQWEHRLASLCKPFTTAKIRYFDYDRIQEARNWLASNKPLQRIQTSRKGA